MNRKQLCVLLMVLFAGVAQAETDNGIYVGIDGVRNSTSFSNENNGADYVNFGGRVFLGNQMNKSVAIEGGYMISPTNTVKVRAGNYAMDYSTFSTAADLSAVFTPLQDAAGLKLKVGMALMSMSIDKKTESRYSHSHNTATTIVPGIVAGVAYEFPLAEDVSANVGYTHYHQILPNSDVALQPLDHTNNVLSLGIKKQF